ncbi:MAG: hypothetical protein OJF59_003046 [Cytophagales bacterium]|nr:glycosyltransferase [Bacteroidota bacterium]MBS1981271.1 glycosyltransferase [Bacteroidota bacterium]WHZ09290.1 MAG: hypothetical protein OJF59_003046 [Cytophagales bacterium]
MTVKNLILLTHHFPFGTGEPFLESEVPWLAQRFNSVVVIAKDVNSTNCRYSAPNFYTERINPQSNILEKIKSLGLFVSKGMNVINCLSDELIYLKSRNKKLTFSILRKMIHDLFKALIMAGKIEDTIRHRQLSGEIVFYSYWFTSSALAISLVSIKGISAKRVTRAHGGDLYPELHPDHYLSFRQVAAQSLDKIYPASETGAMVLKDLVDASLHHKIEVSRLGTTQPSHRPAGRLKDSFVLVSVSSLNRYKRVHLIIEALGQIKNVSIHWIHFGDGVLKEEIEILAKQKLNPSAYDFRGRVSNREIFNFYENNYVDLFINVSSTEGIPVSIMEAQSFGIPCVATHVGANSEIVSNQTGRLVSPKGDPKEIADAIVSLLTLQAVEKNKLRQSVLDNWADHYDSSKNYANFSTNLLNL